MSSLLAIFLFIIAIGAPINGIITRNLDEIPAGSPPDIKCGTCPSCSGSCYQSPPPPPPALPSPPPPHKKPPTPSVICPPPAGTIFVTGPPGDLYPIDTNYSGCVRNFVVGLPLLVSCGFLGLLAFW